MKKRLQELLSKLPQSSAEVVTGTTTPATHAENVHDTRRDFFKKATASLVKSLLISFFNN